VCSIVAWLVVSSETSGTQLWQQISGAIRYVADKRHPLVVILTLYVLITSLYSLITPSFESPDEGGHFDYMVFIARRHCLPTVQDHNHISDLPIVLHPPLYYSLGALVLSALHPFGVPQYQFDLHADPRFWERWKDNWLIHGSEEVFPYHGNTRMDHLLRLIFVAMGALTVLFTYRTATVAFPQNESLAVGAAAVCAFVPQFTFISGMLNNDNLAAMLSSMAIFCLVRILKEASIGSRQLVKLSLIAALGLLTKYTTFFLIPVALVAILLKSKDAKQALKLSFLFLLVVGVVAGWYYYSNVLLYGDPLASKTHLSIDLAVHHKSLTDPFFREIYFPAMYKSFVGNFGCLSIPLPTGMYYAFSLPGLAGGVGLLRLVFSPKAREKSLSTCQKYVVLILLLSIGLLVVGSVMYNLSYNGTQGRYLFPILPALGILVALGLSAFARKARCQKLLWSFLICSMLLLNLFSLFWHLLPAYHPFRPQGMRADLGGVITLIGYELDKTHVEPGDNLKLILFWQGQQKIDRDYTVFTHLLDAHDRIWGQKDSQPLDGTYPTTRWQVGEVVEDVYEIPVRPQALAGTYQLEVGMYFLATMERLNIMDEEGHVLDNRILLTQVQVLR